MAASDNKDELISMEEGRSNIIVKRHEQSEQPRRVEIMQSTNNNIPCANSSNKLQPLKDAIRHYQDKQSGVDKNGPSPKIQKASDMLRGDEKMEKNFTPRMVSIGPLHHGVKFKLAEELKLKLAALFIKKHQLDEDHLYNKINGQIGSLRKWYFEEDIKKFNNDDLAYMFLVDSCALIHYIDCASNDKLRELKIKMDMEAFAQQDLFLLENQLPYEVLDVLITSIKNQNDVRKSINMFVHKIAGNIRGRNIAPSEPQNLPNDAAHLLELLWRLLVGHNKSSQDPKSDNGARDNKPSQELRSANGSSPSSAHDSKSSQARYSFRNVNELKAAGIEFKCDTRGSLRDVSFVPSWFTGTLTLPSLVVDDSTGPKFLNLIAFEMCTDFENYFPVSSYISFLDSLIDEADDAKDLRKADILHNCLGSDAQVATLFNEIATDIVPNQGTYWNVKQAIQTHYKKTWKTWMAQAFHDHFSSPWTFLAFAGAIVALVMSFVQTWYTIYPSK